MNQSFHLLITNPERTFYDGEAQSLSSKNNSGSFDILPDHAHFISLLHNVTVSVMDGAGKPQAWDVKRGLISAEENKVRVFVDL